MTGAAASPEPPQTKAAWLTAALGLAAITNYAYTLLLTHGLDQDGYTVFAAGQGVLISLSTVGAVAVPWVLSRELVLQEGHPDRQRNAVNLAFWINVGIGIVLGAAVAGMTMSFASAATAAVMAGTTLILVVGSTALGYLQGTRRVGILGGTLLAEFTVKVLAGLLFVFVLHLGATAALAAAAVGGLVPLTACLTCRRFIGRPRRVQLSPGLWRAAGRIGILQTMVALFTALDTVLVAVLASTRPHAGPYQAAATLGRIPLFVSVAVSTAVFPVLMASRGSVAHRMVALRALVVVGVVSLIALSSVPVGVVQLFFPISFVPLLMWLPYVTVLGIGIGVLNLLTTFVQSEDHVRPCLRRLIAGFALDVILVVTGGEFFGIRGLVIGAAVGVWLTVVLIAATPTELPAVKALLRGLRAPRPILFFLVFGVGLWLIEQPIVWLAYALIGTAIAVPMAFPEIAAALPLRGRRPRMSAAQK